MACPGVRGPAKGCLAIRHSNNKKLPAPEPALAKRAQSWGAAVCCCRCGSGGRQQQKKVKAVAKRWARSAQRCIKLAAQRGWQSGMGNNILFEFFEEGSLSRDALIASHNVIMPKKD